MSPQLEEGDVSEEDPPVGLDEVLHRPGVWLELVPVGGGQPGQGVAGDEEGGGGVVLTEVLLPVPHPPSPRPHLSLGKGELFGSLQLLQVRDNHLG